MMSLHTDSPPPTRRAAAIFGIDGLDLSQSRSTRRRRRVGIAAGAIVVAVVVALLATRAFGATKENYQVAFASTRDVVATWDGVATIEPTRQASVAFPVGGTVKTVDVQEGDTVVVGQPLAAVDEDAFTETLHQKEAALAQAKLTLSRALDGEDVGGTGSLDGSNGAVVPTSTTTGANQGTSTPSGGDAASPAVAQAQQAVLQAQQQVDAALAKASAVLSSATSVCAQQPSSPEDSQDESGDAADAIACQAALQKVQAQQRATATAQTTLANASRTLDQLLQQQAASAANSAGSPTGSEGSSQTGSSVSSEDLAKYEAAVYADAFDVLAAQQAIKQATIVSPIAGTVATVDIAVGDKVTSGSTTDHIEVVGSGGYEATTTVEVADIADIEVGQSATVIPDGVERSIRGEVVAVSLSPVDDSSSTAYRVTVALKGETDGLRIGSTGSLSIVTERASGALAVPTSAVTVGANRSTVQVLDSSDVKTVTVQVGVIGASWTQILDGVTKGQRVIIADVDEPLPNSATDSSNGNQRGGNFGPPGGFRGGGRFPGR
jgi:multidrug efflux pump subunit AcrA (membrane-fusion protein)